MTKKQSKNNTDDLASVLVLGLASVLVERFTNAYVLGYMLGIAIGVMLFASGVFPLPAQATSPTTTLTTTIQPFNLTCSQIKDVVNTNITKGTTYWVQLAQTYIQLYKAKGCIG